MANCSVSIIGVPTDSNSSFLRGPASAPEYIRRQLFSEMGNLATESGLEIGEDIDVKDLGDLPLLEQPADDEVIESAIVEALTSKNAPLCLGGDHSITFPILRGVSKAVGPVDILHFDAHPDLYDEYDGNRRSHACPFARIMEQGLARRLVQVGIRTLNVHQREQARKFGVEIIDMAEFTVDRIPALEGPLYVSFDLDALDPAFAPGVSHLEPGGLSVRDALRVLASQTAQVVAADVVELNPHRDINGMTATVAAKISKELIGMMAR